MKRPLWKSAAARRVMQMADVPGDVEKAIRVLLERYCVGLERVPVDLEALGRRLDVVSIQRASLNVAGELRRLPGGYAIVCEETLGEGRFRFTVAHELGHALVAKSGRGAPRNGKELERLCDRIAVELLLPYDLVDKELSTRPRLNDIERISRRFRASLSATALRVAELRRLAAFEVSRRGIVWSGGPMRRLPPVLYSTLEPAFGGKRVSDLVYLYERDHEGWWSLEALAMGQSGNVLAVLGRAEAPEPRRRDEPEKAKMASDG